MVRVSERSCHTLSSHLRSAASLYWTSDVFEVHHLPSEENGWTIQKVVA
jgi:hypothetical protein